MTKTLSLIALTAVLAGCTTMTDSAADGAAAATGETIRYSVSPCYGTCPVYAVTVLPNGHVTFDGQEHVAARGPQERQAGVAAYSMRNPATLLPEPGESQPGERRSCRGGVRSNGCSVSGSP